MARPRKPTAELELRGAFKKDPQRRRVDPKTKGPIGNPPPGMGEHMHATWYELIEHSPLNVLKSRDRIILELAVRVLYAIRLSDVPDTALVSQLKGCLSSMGMTPADASKVHAPQEKPANPFAKFAGKASEARAARKTH
jgi:hypothetical protein